MSEHERRRLEEFRKQQALLKAKIAEYQRFLESDDETYIGIFNEDAGAEYNKEHPVHDMELIGGSLASYRRSLPREVRGKGSFGRYFRKYFGRAVDRGTLTRAERGDTGVGWGLYAAYFYEMGVMDEIIKILRTGDEPSTRHLLLLRDEMRDEVEKVASDGQKVLVIRRKRETKSNRQVAKGEKE